MTTLTLHITNQDILPSLIDTLKHFNGVSIVTPNDCTSNNPTLLDKKKSQKVSRNTRKAKDTRCLMMRQWMSLLID